MSVKRTRAYRNLYPKIGPHILKILALAPKVLELRTLGWTYRKVGESLHISEQMAWNLIHPGPPVTEQQEAVKFLKYKLHIPLDGLEVPKLLLPAIEQLGFGRIYIKFMSDGGVLDDELGRRFAQRCQRTNRVWKSDRPSAGVVLARQFPSLREV